MPCSALLLPLDWQQLQQRVPSEAAAAAAAAGAMSDHCRQHRPSSGCGGAISRGGRRTCGCEAILVAAWAGVSALIHEAEAVLAADLVLHALTLSAECGPVLLQAWVGGRGAGGRARGMLLGRRRVRAQAQQGTCTPRRAMLGPLPLRHTAGWQLRGGGPSWLTWAASATMGGGSRVESMSLRSNWWLCISRRVACRSHQQDGEGGAGGHDWAPQAGGRYQ